MKETLGDRLEYLRELLEKGEPCSQEEIAQKLERASFHVTQSTVSRDLRKLGAVRIFDDNGKAVYRIGTIKSQPFSEAIVSGMQNLVESIRTNGSLIVIRTQPSTASLIALFIDSNFKEEILGTIAGDDTVFVAPAKVPVTELLLKKIEYALLDMKGNEL